MRKALTELGTVSNLREYLSNTKLDEIVLRTSMVKGGWYENELTAHLCGFEISRFENDLLTEMGEFAKCYLITRRKNG